MAAQDQSSDFDALEPVEVDDDTDDEDAEWIDLDEGESVVGEIREIKENCGDYDSRVYKIARGLGDVCLLWGKASIDRQIDSGDLGPGSVVGIKNTGETYTTESGNEGTRYEVRSTN